VYLYRGAPGDDAGKKIPAPTLDGGIPGWKSFGQDAAYRTRISAGGQEADMGYIFLRWKSSSKWNA
jgi:hypothetical protein